VHPLRRLPPAHPRIRRADDADSYRGTAGGTRELHAGRVAAAFVWAGAFGEVNVAREQQVTPIALHRLSSPF